MKIQIFKEPFEFIVIDDFYTDEELAGIWQELDFLTPKLKDPSQTGSATDSDGNLLKRNKGIFLDSSYNDRTISNILSVNRKIFSKEIVKVFDENYGPLFKLYKNSNFDSTLVNYYEKSDYYEPHEDLSIFTALTMLYKEPKNFTGGDLIFPGYDVTIECRSNRLVIFPSMTAHAVNSVNLTKSLDGNFGRYSIAQFISYNFLTENT